jgi:glycosyltransferase involved in cell wall biosynthesis
MGTYLKREHQSSRAWLDSVLPILKGKRILLFLSRIHPQKGTEFLIDAWAVLQREFPDWHLVMAGPDCNGHRAELEARASHHGCAQSIMFLGEVYGSRKTTLYAASDLFILPSISESFPRVVLEALAAAVPVIATTGAPWHDLVTYKCGWWVDAATGPLLEALRDGMSMTEQQRHEAGLRGRDLVVARYDWSTIAA